MKMIGKLFKLLAILIIGVLVFNRVIPFLLKENKESGLDTSVEDKGVIEDIVLLNEEVYISARLVEEGRWIILVEEEKSILGSAFIEQGIYSTRENFTPYIKTKIYEHNPSLDTKAFILTRGCSQDVCEIHVRGRKAALVVIDVLKEVYATKDNAYQDVAKFKSSVKKCLFGNSEKSSFLCGELEENPLPSPEPSILYIDKDGNDVPLKGFSECYFKKTAKFKVKQSDETYKKIKESCYSEW